MPELSPTIIFKDESYAIQGAIFEVHNVMGNGFLEAVYQECLEKEFRLRNIPFEAQYGLQLAYKGDPLKQKIYLHATDFKLGMLVNFSAYPKTTVMRILNTDKVHPV